MEKEIIIFNKHLSSNFTENPLLLHFVLKVLRRILRNLMKDTLVRLSK